MSASSSPATATCTPFLSSVVPCNGFPCSANGVCICPNDYSSQGDMTPATANTCMINQAAIQTLYSLAFCLWLLVLGYAIAHFRAKVRLNRISWARVADWQRDNTITIGVFVATAVPMMALCIRRATYPTSTAIGVVLADSVLFAIAYSLFGLSVLLFIMLIVNLIDRNALLKGKNVMEKTAFEKSRVSVLLPILLALAIAASCAQLASVGNPALIDVGAQFYFIGWAIFAILAGFVVTPYFFTRLIRELYQACTDSSGMISNSRNHNHVLRTIANRMVILRAVSSIGGGGQALFLLLFASVSGLRECCISYQIPLSLICNALIIFVALAVMDNGSRINVEGNKDGNAQNPHAKETSSSSAAAGRGGAVVVVASEA